MATTQDVIELILRTKGTEAIPALRKDLAAVKEKIDDVAGSWKRGDINSAAALKQLKALSAEERLLSGALAGVESQARGTVSGLGRLEQATDKLERVSGRARSGMQGLGQAGLQTGRIIQDFAQGGIPGVLNNIEGFTQAVGGGAGLAGILTALGVGVFLLKKPIGEFIESLSAGDVTKFGTALEGLKAKIKELNENPLHAVDRHELEALEKRVKEIEAAAAKVGAMAAKPKPEAEALGKEVEEKIGEHIPGGVEALKAQARRSPDFLKHDTEHGELEKFRQQLEAAKQLSAKMDEAAERPGATKGSARAAELQRQAVEELETKVGDLDAKIRANMENALNVTIKRAVEGSLKDIEALEKLAPGFKAAMGKPTAAQAEGQQKAQDAARKAEAEAQAEAQKHLGPLLPDLQAMFEQGQAARRKPQEIDAAIRDEVLKFLTKNKGMNVIDAAGLAGRAPNMARNAAEAQRREEARALGLPDPRDARPRRKRAGKPKPLIRIRERAGAPVGKAAQPPPKPRLPKPPAVRRPPGAVPLGAPVPAGVPVGEAAFPPPKPRLPMPVISNQGRGNSYVPDPGQRLEWYERQLEPMDLPTGPGPPKPVVPDAEPIVPRGDVGPGAQRALPASLDDGAAKEVGATMNAATQAVGAAVSVLSGLAAQAREDRRIIDAAMRELRTVMPTLLTQGRF